MENINKPHTPIHAWSEDERPREKMMHQGAAALSQAELIALLITNGHKSRSAVDLGKDLLEQADGSLHRLTRMSIEEMCKVPGIGHAKAIIIKAAMELAVRKEAELLKNRDVIRSSKDIVPFLRKRIGDDNVESFWVVFLNKGLRIIKSEILSQGGITGTVVDAKTVLARALELKATSLILSHNHPSGNLKPSQADRDLTARLKAAAAIFDISIIDHLIVSQEGYYSFSEAGDLL
jgi:DNA repair protein RadC